VGVDGADDAVDVVCEVGREVDAIREPAVHEGTRSQCVDFVAVEACTVLVSDARLRCTILTVFISVGLLKLCHDLHMFR
jgi:aerobic-type carbon monoxide dehydrogenase small subunit (CoxS/CutS family)